MRAAGIMVTWLGGATFAAGLWFNLRADVTPSGEQTPAAIVATHPSRLWILDGADIDVEYAWGGKDYRTTLTQSRLVLHDAFPKHLNVFVDPADPTHVGTLEGYISDGGQAWLARVPLVLSVPIIAIGMAIAPPRTHSTPPARKPDEPPVVTQFDVVVRGYDRNQVNEFVQAVRESAPLPDVHFDVVIRGFDREQVDRYVASVMERMSSEG